MVPEKCSVSAESQLGMSSAALKQPLKMLMSMSAVSPNTEVSIVDLNVPIGGPPVMLSQCKALPLSQLQTNVSTTSNLIPPIITIYAPSDSTITNCNKVEVSKLDCESEQDNNSVIVVEKIVSSSLITMATDWKDNTSKVDSIVLSLPNAKDIYNCEECTYSSHNKHYLKQHFDLVHNSQRRYKCPYCDYAGKRSYALKEHLIVHSSEWPYQCTHCNATFRKKGHLTNHSKMHISQQVIRCSLCDDLVQSPEEGPVLSSVTATSTQQESDPATAKPVNSSCKCSSTGQHSFACRLCDYRTEEIVSLKAHEATHNNLPAEISESGNKAASETVMMKCTECGFTAAENAVMTNHMWQHIHKDTKNKQQQQPQQQPQQQSKKSPITSTDGISGHKIQVPTTSSSQSLVTAIQTNVIYKCTECNFQSNEANNFFAHMILHQEKNQVLVIAPQTTLPSSVPLITCTTTVAAAAVAATTTSPPQPTPSSPSSSLLSSSLPKSSTSTHKNRLPANRNVDFTHDQVAGRFQCTICGYSCELQRTIKAHIWKHSGHRDVDYPMFQNGPLSIYEDSENKGYSLKPFNTNLITKTKSDILTKSIPVVAAASVATSTAIPTTITTPIVSTNIDHIQKPQIVPALSMISKEKATQQNVSPALVKLLACKKDGGIRLMKTNECHRNFQTSKILSVQNVVLSPCPAKSMTNFEEQPNNKKLIKLTLKTDTPEKDAPMSTYEHKEKDSVETGGNRGNIPNCNSPLREYEHPQEIPKKDNVDLKRKTECINDHQMVKKNCLQKISVVNKDPTSSNNSFIDETIFPDSLSIPDESNRCGLGQNCENGNLHLRPEKKIIISSEPQINDEAVISPEDGVSLKKNTDCCNQNQTVSKSPTKCFLEHDKCPNKNSNCDRDEQAQMLLSLLKHRQKEDTLLQKINLEKELTISSEIENSAQEYLIKEIESERSGSLISSSSPETRKNTSQVKNDSVGNQEQDGPALVLLSLLKCLSSFQSETAAGGGGVKQVISENDIVELPQDKGTATLNPIGTNPTTVTTAVSDTLATASGIADMKPKSGISSSLLAVIEQLHECSKSESESENLAVHSQTKHGVKKVKPNCIVADDENIPLDKLDNIEQLQQDNNIRFRCKLCHYTNSSCAHLQQHMRLHKIKKPFECSFCEFLASSSEVLQNHMIQHCKMRTYQCKWCPSNFNYKSQLRAHMRAHNNKEPLNCEDCEFETTNPVIFRKHMQQHLKVDHCCRGCKERFPSKQDLWYHRKTSTCSVSTDFSEDDTNKELHCSYCNKQFVSANEKINHMHDCIKEWWCQQCNYHCNSNHSQQHGDKTPQKCEMCDFTASSSRSLKSHMKRHVNDQRLIQQLLEQYKCNLCGYVCHHLPSLKSHMWRHASDKNYSYEFTNEVINAAIDYDSRLENPDSDDSGSDSSELAVNKLNLSGEEATRCMVTFRCCQCSYETINKSLLNSHMKTHLDIIQRKLDVYQAGTNQPPPPLQLNKLLCVKDGDDNDNTTSVPQQVVTLRNNIQQRSPSC